MSDAQLHRDISLNFIKNNGLRVVLAKPGTKMAKFKASHGYSDEDSRQAIHILETSNDHNFGLVCHGDVVDIDVDSDDPLLKEMLAEVLSDTPHRWGRPSNPNSHFVYRVTPPEDQAAFERTQFPILKTLKRLANVEVIGGATDNKSHCLLPGSFYPTDGGREHSQWVDPEAAKGPMRVIPITELLGRIRKAAAISILAPYWSEGNRHFLCMALSGMLFRLYSLTQEPEFQGNSVDDFNMDRDASERFLRHLLKWAGDTDRENVNQRIKTFRSTWRKGQEGDAITGGATLDEYTGQEGLANKLYQVLSSNPTVTKIEEFLNRFAMFGKNYVDLEKARKVENLADAVMDFQTFDNLHGHWHYTRSDGKRVYLAPRLKRFESRIEIDRFDLYPDKESTLVPDDDKVVYNLWAGYRIPPHPEPVEDEEVRMFIDYVWNIVADHDEDSYHWVLAWLSNLLGEPHLKPGTALVLVGKQGTGKTWISEKILQPIIGRAHSTSFSNVYNLVRNFNVPTARKVLVTCNEATSRKQRAIFDQLKSFVTEDEAYFEPKGKESIRLTNLARVIFTSNHVYDAVHLPDGDDRRYTILKVSDAEKQNLTYWGQFYEWLQQPDTLAKIHRWLIDYVPPDHIDARTPIRSATKKIIEGRSSDVFDQWLLAMVERGHPLPEHLHKNWWECSQGSETSKKAMKRRDRSEWPEYVRYDQLVESLRQFYRTSGERDLPSPSQTTIGIELTSRGLNPGGRKVQKHVDNEVDAETFHTMTGRVNLRKFPPFEQIKEYLSSIHDLSDHDIEPIEEDEDDNPAEDNAAF